MDQLYWRLRLPITARSLLTYWLPLRNILILLRTICTGRIPSDIPKHEARLLQYFPVIESGHSMHGLNSRALRGQEVCAHRDGLEGDSAKSQTFSIVIQADHK